MADIRKTFGEAVRAMRRGRKLTQAALGKRAGLSGKFVGEIERGVGNPSLVTMAAVAKALGVGMRELFGRSGSGSARGSRGAARR